jgi:hypothetical protein
MGLLIQKSERKQEIIENERGGKTEATSRWEYCAVLRRITCFILGRIKTCPFDIWIQEKYIAHLTELQVFFLQIRWFFEISHFEQLKYHCKCISLFTGAMNPGPKVGRFPARIGIIFSGRAWESKKRNRP